MGAIDTTKLAGKLKKNGFTQRVRTRAHSGGNVSACLMEFRGGNYVCQIDIHDNGRQCIIIGEITTGVPKEGWISGDWIAFGEDPKCCPELGTTFAEFILPQINARCFRYKMVPEEVSRVFVERANLSSWLPKVGLKTNEMLVATPEYVVLNLRDRNESELVDAFEKLRDLARCFALSPQSGR